MLKSLSLETEKPTNFLYQHPYFQISAIFLGSRIVILAIAIFIQQILSLPDKSGLIIGSVNLLDINLESALNNLGKGDIGWYHSIMNNGYDILPFENTQQHNWAFFPFWLIVWQLFNQIIPNRMASGIIAANIFFFLALINIYKISISLGLSNKLANITLLLISFSPLSYFFSFPFTESLFLFLSTSFFLCCINDQWMFAGLWGSLASATRPNGIILLLLPLLYLVINIIKKKPPIFSLIVCCFLTSLGLLSYMFYLHQITGNAFAFQDIQVAWGKKNIFWLVTIYSYLKNIFFIVDEWNFRFFNLAAFFVGVFASVVIWRSSNHIPSRFLRQFFAIYLLINLLIPSNTGILTSLARYTSAVFPVFIGLTIFFHKYKLEYPLAIIFAVLLGMMTTLYSLGFVFAAT